MSVRFKKPIRIAIKELIEKTEKEREEELAERLVLGSVLGGAIAAGLFKLKPPAVAINAKRTVISPQSITATPATLLPATTYKFAIIFFHGDGDSTLTLTVTRGTQTFTLTGADQAIETVANESIQIDATSGSGNSPTIEIVYLEW